MAAPVGKPQSLRRVSTNSTSVHIMWDRINCTERNGEIIGYKVTYFPRDNSADKKFAYVAGTEELSRQYVAHQLTPHSTYTFVVVAVSNFEELSYSLNVSIDVETNTTTGNLSFQQHNFVLY